LTGCGPYDQRHDTGYKPSENRTHCSIHRISHCGKYTYSSPMRTNIHKNVTFPPGGIVCWNSFCNKYLLKRYHRQCLIPLTESLYAMQEYQQTPAEPSRKDNSRIYFFVIAIVALLATNVYFYVKYKTSDERVAVLSDEKSRLEAEIDRQE